MCQVLTNSLMGRAEILNLLFFMPINPVPMELHTQIRLFHLIDLNELLCPA